MFSLLLMLFLCLNVMKILIWDYRGTMLLVYGYKEDNLRLEEFVWLLVCLSNEVFSNEEKQMGKELSLVIVG